MIIISKNIELINEIKMTKLAFLGLGVMGFPMARHLVDNGNDVVVYNRTRTKAEKFSANFKTKIADKMNREKLRKIFRVGLSIVGFRIAYSG